MEIRFTIDERAGCIWYLEHPEGKDFEVTKGVRDYLRNQHDAGPGDTVVVSSLPSGSGDPVVCAITRDSIDGEEWVDLVNEDSFRICDAGLEQLFGTLPHALWVRVEKKPRLVKHRVTLELELDPGVARDAVKDWNWTGIVGRRGHGGVLEDGESVRAVE